MALTLVYTADHFVFDILLGWAYVIVVVLAFRYVAARCPDAYRRGSTPTNSRGLPDARTT